MLLLCRGEALGLWGRVQRALAGFPQILECCQSTQVHSAIAQTQGKRPSLSEKRQTRCVIHKAYK